MAFRLKQVVPWGRTLLEYKKMFALTECELETKIAGFGDGPASFNYEVTKMGGRVTSFDPIYQFTKEEIQSRIQETKELVIQQTKGNVDHYNWETIKDVEELERVRMKAMQCFLKDFEQGKQDRRYRYHELPEAIPVADQCFDLGLSSHFLLLYPQLGVAFHIASIKEMLRVCKEVRIFPLLDLDGKKSAMLPTVIDAFEGDFFIQIQKVDYEFQKNSGEMLRIKNKSAVLG